ncbi:molybdopterin molybdotransferase MoeA [Propionibacterium freudenreichii]|uniref:molybdopterin molybdotransferase MoeA n=1 Tax=Propionibacterium freudenreichii TaxID=1744 RepID=UPI000BC31F5D|nr:gephyrin-like molybdotransferase Glp [Propionibacterium freudenreichii]MDK9295046.1 molybdopterin molybdotransferase MoeA [Propionibacterium freudenreichii]MDK9360414.1 molybdopterin molybdotransferase MoeA [Propionibacterium freudenreichii]MDK9639079.1 molybdopterin molybdotransferase MoeA [Propionibacterium freudenreichii]MDK9659381.1 molybdopterin molybdotransferase MoeA [Propionibacterium freudenreichii]WGU90774.1 molybdopterin molybdotransferase MoeA [Propionibacterium freudenreichii]
MALFGRKRAPVAAEPEPEPDPTLPGAPAPQANGLRSVSAHRDFLLSKVQPLMPFGMRLLDAWGLSLCEDLVADGDLPPLPEAESDGYAVIALDVRDAAVGTRVQLSVRGDVQKVGSAVPVYAGQPMPPGADAVLPLAQVRREGQELSVLAPVVTGEHVRPTGIDAAMGEVLIHAGKQLDARAIGLLAGAGFDKVFCRPRPRIVVLAVGEQLADDAPASMAERRRDAASYMVAAAAKADGAQVWRESVAGTTPDDVAEVVSDQLIRADLMVICGGTAGGRDSLVGRSLKSLGQTDFAEVAMEPGGLQGFGIIGQDEVPVVMLPADPLAAYVAFELFAHPLIRTLMGARDMALSSVDCRLTMDVSGEAGLMQVVAGVITRDAQQWSVTPLDFAQGSLTTLVDADALIVLPAELGTIAAGAVVTCWLLDRD